MNNVLRDDVAHHTNISISNDYTQVKLPYKGENWFGRFFSNSLKTEYGSVCLRQPNVNEQIIRFGIHAYFPFHLPFESHHSRIRHVCVWQMWQRSLQPIYWLLFQWFVFFLLRRRRHRLRILCGEQVNIAKHFYMDAFCISIFHRKRKKYYDFLHHKYGNSTASKLFKSVQLLHIYFQSFFSEVNYWIHWARNGINKEHHDSREGKSIWISM